MHARVLVAGGAGFLGSHLCERLLSLGHEVIALDNLSTGALANVSPLLDNPRFSFRRQDVQAPVHADVSLVFNLAACAPPLYDQRNAIGTFTTSIMGTRNLLGLAQRCGARFVQASSGGVYGDPQQHPQREDYCGNVNPIGPRACYDEGNRAAETLCFDYARTQNLSVRVARIFNTYGPRMALDNGRVIAKFVVQALRGECLTIHGDGQQTRSFCYVSDLIEGLLRLAESPVAGPVNLGYPQECTILALAEQVLALTRSESPIVFAAAKTDDPRRRRPNIELARSALQWTPQISLNEGLERTIAYVKTRLLAAA